MNWLSFFIGVLVGWIVAWLIGFFYWRRRYRSCLEEREALQSRLSEAERRLRTFQVKGRQPEAEPQPIPAVDVAAVEAAMAPAGAELAVEVEAPEVELPDTGIDAFFDGLRTRFPDVDLDGSIDRLKARFPDLDLRTALDGLKVDFPDLDIDGAFDRLKAKLPHLGVGAAAGELRAGLAEVVPTKREERDDLKLIEGIGPKISQLLRDDGILTFAQLASTSVDRLQAILQAAGPNFQLADPTTWSEQAKLAAEGAWDELQVLQDRLIGGRQTRR